MSDEKRLIKFLLGNYAEVGVVGRPVLNHSETIKVYYGLSLVQILDLDEKNQVLQTNVWSRYVSTDWFSGETSYRPGGQRDDMPPADGSLIRGGSTSVRGRVRSPHMAELQAASVPIT